MLGDKNKLNVRFWKVQDGQKSFQFPELNKNDPMYYAQMDKRSNSGIAISGGGTVSASLIQGYFKALQEKDALEKIAYISGVSGGCWGSAPFAFLPGGSAAEQKFYASVKDPSQYYADEKDKSTQRTTSVNENPKGSMTSVVTNAKLADLTIENSAHKHEAYERAVGAIFLNQLGINSPNSDFADRQYFTCDANTLNDLLTRNPHLKQEAENGKIMTMSDGRPYLIMNTTMLIPSGDVNNPYYNFPFEITPSYAGMYAKQNLHSENGTQIGGAFVESAGFNTIPDGPQGNSINTHADYRYELCEPVGTSGSAIEEAVLKKKNIEKDAAFWLPQFKYWNPEQVQNGNAPEPQEIYFGDGGIIENTGIVPLILRGVKNIASFISQPILLKNTYNSSDKNIKFNTYEIFGYNEIACLFGEKLLKVENEEGKGDNKLEVITQIDDKMNRKIFDNSGGQFQQILDAFANTDPNDACVFKQELITADNNLFGIKGGQKITVVWSVIQPWEGFNSQLPQDLQSEIINHTGELHNFPKIAVLFQNSDTIIQLTAAQANLLGSYGYKMICDNWDNIYQNVLATEEKMIQD